MIFRFVSAGTRYVERPHHISSPFSEIGLELAMNDRLPEPEEWFPNVWQD